MFSHYQDVNSLNARIQELKESLARIQEMLNKETEQSMIWKLRNRCENLKHDIEGFELEVKSILGDS